MDKSGKSKSATSNRSLLEGITSRINQSDSEDTPKVSTGPFSANLSAVANPRAPGEPDSIIRRTAVQRQLWVDPILCRPWIHHNRDHDLLSEDRCADLIAGFRTLGRQQRPAIVRTISAESRQEDDNRGYEFEIISGVRRHWTVSWLREHGEANAQGEPFLFLVVVRDDLDTTAAFELSDAENRGQKDISDFERAREYRWALEKLYEENVSRMAQAIQMDRSNLTRLLALTEMPKTIVNAYPSILEIRTRHWRQLRPIFASKERDQVEAAKRVLECARSIAQARAANSRNAPKDGAGTAAMLMAAVKEKTRGGDRTQLLRTVNAQATGKLAIRVKRTTRGITLDVVRSSGATKDEVQEALRQAIDDYFEK